MRVGFLGGSFDPIHLGHLWIALFSREQLGLDRVLIVPAGVSAPQGGDGRALSDSGSTRPTRGGGDGRHRGHRTSRRTHRAPSYTVESLRALRASLAPEDEIWLLLGADSLADLPLWYRPDEILELATRRLRSGGISGAGAAWRALRARSTVPPAAFHRP